MALKSVWEYDGDARDFCWVTRDDTGKLVSMRDAIKELKETGQVVELRSTSAETFWRMRDAEWRVKCDGQYVESECTTYSDACPSEATKRTRRTRCQG